MRNFLKSPTTYLVLALALFAANVAVAVTNAASVEVQIGTWALAVVSVLVGGALQLRKNAREAEMALLKAEIDNYLTECMDCVTDEAPAAIPEVTYTKYHVSLTPDSPATAVAPAKKAKAKAKAKKKAAAPVRKKATAKKAAKAAKKTTPKKKASRR